MNDETIEIIDQTEIPTTSEEVYHDESVQTEGETDSIPTPEESVEILKAEISDLREKLQKQGEEISRKVREIEEFNRLFPHASISDLPSSVTALVTEGVPLAAAYALYEKEVAAKQAKAGEINRKNAFLSAGKAGIQTGSEFFTPDEVRAMSQRQVHENYSKIRESMKHWRNKTFY